MANTRARKPKTEKPAETTEAEFDPSAVAKALNRPEATAYPEDTDGDISGEVFDTGSPQDEEQDIVTGAEEVDTDTDNVDDNPSASQPLGKTTAGMSQGAQAAQAEVRNYLERKAVLLEEAAAVRTDLKELDKEFKDRGYDMKAMNLLAKLDGMTEGQKQARREQNVINETYAVAAKIDLDLL
jgi:uncharacterized protein (UPF0335 family)